MGRNRPNRGLPGGVAMPTIVAKGLRISTNSTMAYGMTTRGKSSMTSFNLASPYPHDLCSPRSCLERVLYD